MKMTPPKESGTYSKPSTGTVKTGKWSNAEIKKLITLANQDMEVADIAIAINRTEAAVQSQMFGPRVRSKLKESVRRAIPARPQVALAFDIPNLRKGQCRWPCGDFFCKMNNELGSPYCDQHTKKALQPNVKPLNLKGLLS